MAAISNIRVQWPDPSGVTPVVHLPLDALPVAVAIVDTDGVLLALNRAWVAAHPNAAPGADALEWCGEDLRAPVLAAIRRALEPGHPNSTHDFGPDSSR